MSLIFVPQMDSYGYDYNYVIFSDKNKYKEICLNDPNCIGFNELGYLKYYVNNLRFFNNFSGMWFNQDKIKNQTTEPPNIIRVKIIANWLSNNQVPEYMYRMTKYNTWNRLNLSSNDADYYVILNKPKMDDYYESNKTIVFQMEPEALDNKDLGTKSWGEWSNPNPDYFLQVRTHKFFHNNLEWHLDKTYNQLKTETIQKTKIFSSIITDNNFYPGHAKRIAFLKFLDTNLGFIDIYGRCKSLNFLNYKDECPAHDKSNALLPYKYSFACENNNEFNYFTEKIADCILSECLCFYWGCENLEEYFPKAFIRLQLNDFDNDLNIIKNAIANNEWENRLEYIKLAKKKILEEMHLLPTIEQIILAHRGQTMNFNKFFEKIVLLNKTNELDENNTNILNNYDIEFDIVACNNTALLDLLTKCLENNINTILFIPNEVFIIEENISKIFVSLNELIQKNIEWNQLSFTNFNADYKQIGYSIYEKQGLSKGNCFAIKNYNNYFDILISKLSSNIYLYDSVKDEKTIYLCPELCANNLYNIKTFCINLPRRSDRKTKMLEIFKENNLTVEFFDAIDGKECKGTQELLYLFRNNKFNYRLAVIGCALSHLTLWKKLLSDPYNENYLIFEDDISISENFNKKVTVVINRLTRNHKNWHICLIGYCNFTGNQIITKPLNLLPKNALISGSFGYIINKTGAQVIIDYIEKNGFSKPVDNFLVSMPNLVVYISHPCLVTSPVYVVMDPNCKVDTDIQNDYATLLKTCQFPSKLG